MTERTVPVLPADKLVPLAECPIGLFFAASGELCLKTECGS